MKVKGLMVAGFRGFPRSQSFDLDADAVIVAGVNGSGKTSMFDALLWGLTGSIQRIHGDPSEVVSKYSSSGEARVELLLDTGGRDMELVRRFDGRGHLTVNDGTSEVSGPAAEAKLLEVLWPDAKFAPEPQVALSRSLTRATYLQQDLVREFVESDSEQIRFQVVSELVGVGRVEELQRNLEVSRTNWSRATNSIEPDIASLRSQLAAVQERVTRLGALDADAMSEDAFRTWIDSVARFLQADESSRLANDRSAQTLDRALTALQARQLSEERRATALERLVEHLSRPVAMPPDLAPQEAAERAADRALGEASQRLAAAREQAVQRRREQVEQAERSESQRTLAQLALQHLGETCPVCDQGYDEEATRARLEELVRGVGENEAALPVEHVQDMVAQVEAAERHLADVKAQSRNVQIAQDARKDWEVALGRLANEVQLEPSEGLKDRAEAGLASAREDADAIRDLRAEGEGLSVQLARSVELAQRGELERQAENVNRDLVMRERELAKRIETGALATTLVERLRDVNAGIISTELVRIEPLLQRIYAQVDPHPSFRAVNFLTRTVRGHGRLWTSLSDRTADVSVDEPSTVLSSSQLNVLAVSTFLSLNLAIDSLPLQVVALDDPLQSLDTVNLLGLADLLRRLKASRQVIVSTHDERLAALLARKLRPVSEGERTCLIRLQAWSREGPAVEQEAIPADIPSLRLVASG